ncbi:ABC transporter substrate-binding protein [Ruixingdingia sedimenti]|uniref:ABC transporter substrate-binding protein n=1 Tax=Ruixingdingia sedimenti TaxID=3073604 RepID=A0ABU1F7I6_9RHOB|nr:ABC transporter substrate-binding protein [Xinfangfangia sp. LG-4]MDR5652784.1 ABC transporter substrate-binding protein [Xinfangfangia sp. LG-4]
MVQTNRRNVMKMLGASVAAGALGLPMYARAQSAPYKMGMVTALSGPSEMLGRPMLAGAEYAVAEINAAGGINGRQIELLVRDSKGRPDAGTVAARELIGEGCVMLLGTVSSAVALAISGILQQENALLMTAAAHSLRLTHEDFNRHYFRVTDNPYMRQRAQAKLMAELNGDVTAWGGLVPDHEYGRSTWDSFKHGLETYYPEIAGKTPSISDPILCQYGGSDYRNYIASAMRDPGVGFFNSLYGGDAITMFQQAKPYGFFQRKAPIVDSANEFIAARAMKAEMPDMWIGSHWYHGAFKGNEINDRIYAKYLEQTGIRFPDGFLSEGHAAVMAYAGALAKDGAGTAEALIPALEGLSFETATGTRTIRAEDHQAIKPVINYRVRSAQNEDGFEVVDFRVIDGAETIEPASPGAPVAW